MVVDVSTILGGDQAAFITNPADSKATCTVCWLALDQPGHSPKAFLRSASEREIGSQVDSSNPFTKGNHVKEIFGHVVASKSSIVDRISLSQVGHVTRTARMAVLKVEPPLVHENGAGVCHNHHIQVNAASFPKLHGQEIAGEALCQQHLQSASNTGGEKTDRPQVDPRRPGEAAGALLLNGLNE